MTELTHVTRPVELEFFGYSTQGNDSRMLGNFRTPDPRPTLTKRLRVPVDKGCPSQAPVPVTHYFALKRVLDVIFAIGLSIVLAPIVAVMALVVWLTSEGPAFYTQVRLGRFGKPFLIWKLRTMAHNAEQKSGARWSARGDRRVTPIGRVLRKLHIDEFPQLLNVIRGEMSLVGPRPERPEFFPILSAEVPNYSRRLLVKPGVTGIAQVYLPPDEDLADVRRKQLHDLYYIGAISLWLDLRILIATALQCIGVPHVIVRRTLLLPKQEQIEQPGTRKPVAEMPRPTPPTVHVASPEPVAQSLS